MSSLVFFVTALSGNDGKFVLFHHNKQAGDPKVTSRFLRLSIKEENFGTESLIRSLGRKCSGNSKEKDLASLKIDEICIKGKSWEINVKKYFGEMNAELEVIGNYC